MAVFCLLCGKRFQAQSALQQHMEVHAGVRSYICSECNRTFPSHTALKRHLRSHTGKPVQGMAGPASGIVSGFTSENRKGRCQAESALGPSLLKVGMEGLPLCRYMLLVLLPIPPWGPNLSALHGEDIH